MLGCLEETTMTLQRLDGRRTSALRSNLKAWRLLSKLERLVFLSLIAVACVRMATNLEILFETFSLRRPALASLWTA